MNFFEKIRTFFKKPTTNNSWLEGYEAFNQGKAFFSQEEFQKALHCFDTAIDSGYEGADAYGLRGTCLQSLEFHLDAIDDFTKAIEFDPQDSNNYFQRSFSRAAIGDLHRRIDDLNEAIRLAGIDSASTRIHSASAREMGHKDGVSGMYRMQILVAKLDLEQQAADELRLQSSTNGLDPNPATKRQSQSIRRRRSQ